MRRTGGDFAALSRTGPRDSLPRRCWVSCAAVSLLTPDDLFLFNQGTHYRLYNKLGAHVVSGGTHFAVWAPNAAAVSVIGDWNGWRSGQDRLTPRESSGIWEATVPGI